MLTTLTRQPQNSARPRANSRLGAIERGPAQASSASPSRRAAPLASLLTLAAFLSACAAPGAHSLHRPTAARPSAPSGAEARALARLEPDPERARAILEAALTRDPFDGATCNNLGALHFAAGRMREAALAFSEARRLLPGAPEPRANLAMALERAGLFDGAIEAYESALECDPRHWPAIIGLARLHGLTEPHSPAHAARLALIAREAPDPAWRAWAAGSPGAAPPPSPPSPHS